MKTVTVTALRAFEHQGRGVRRGDAVSMTPIDAAVAARRGDVSLTKRKYQTAAVEPEAAANPESPRRRRRYQRRDMVAEDVSS